jgi:hypothetical protein
MINKLVFSLVLQLKQHSMHLLDSDESDQVPASLLVRACTQLTVHLSTLLSVLLGPYLGLSYGVFYGAVFANAYLGTAGEEVTSFKDMRSHLIVLSWRSTSAKVRSKTQDASADSA